MELNLRDVEAGESYQKSIMVRPAHDLEAIFNPWV